MKRGQKDPTTGVTDGQLRTLLKSNLRPIVTVDRKNCLI